MTDAEKTKNIMMQAQTYQQQLQGLMAQKEAFKMQSDEIEKAIVDLEKITGEEVYKMSGPILLKSKKNDVMKDLKEKQELIKTQLKTIEKSEEKAKSKLDELRDKIGPPTQAG